MDKVNQQCRLSNDMSTISGWYRGGTEIKAATANRHNGAKALANAERPKCGVGVCGACGGQRRKSWGRQWGC